MILKMFSPTYFSCPYSGSLTVLSRDPLLGKPCVYDVMLTTVPCSRILDYIVMFRRYFLLKYRICTLGKKVGRL